MTDCPEAQLKEMKVETVAGVVAVDDNSVRFTQGNKEIYMPTTAVWGAIQTAILLGIWTPPSDD